MISKSALPTAISWDTVPVLDIAVRLGYASALHRSAISAKTDLAIWRMEQDDAPILRYLLREHAPRRHLEFGTWQGLGTLLCLEETNATVWTIDRLEPELKSSGDNAYGIHPEDLEAAKAWARRVGLMVSENPITDAFGYIGWRYLEKSLGHRVCQIYSDSAAWDTSAYPSDFFDSVLIDGGHTPEIVANDTDKAFRVARSGALILWHDFCPPMRRSMGVVEGVMSGMERMSSWLPNQLSDLFWINPSWILAGIKK